MRAVVGETGPLMRRLPPAFACILLATAKNLYMLYPELVREMLC